MNTNTFENTGQVGEGPGVTSFIPRPCNEEKKGIDMIVAALCVEADILDYACSVVE